MPQLRNTLGSPNDPEVKALMALMETQSHLTLITWACTEAMKYDLPLTQDNRLRTALEGALAGMPLPEFRPLLAEARKAAGKSKHPVTQAASRAVASACTVVSSPTSALGYCFYHAAAYAYATAGIQAAQEKYDELGRAAMEQLLESLRKVAVADEPNPAKLRWEC